VGGGGNRDTLKVWVFSKKSLNYVCKECAGALSWWRHQLPVDHKSSFLSCTASCRWWRTFCSTFWWLINPVVHTHGVEWKSDESIRPSLKCCLPSTDAIDRWEKIHACIWRFFKVTSCKCASLKSTRFLEKKGEILFEQSSMWKVYFSSLI